MKEYLELTGTKQAYRPRNSKLSKEKLIEAGGYKNQDAVYNYFKSVSLIPVHYESVTHSKRKAYDVASEMYPPQQRLYEVGEHIYKIKQLIDIEIVEIDERISLTLKDGVVKAKVYKKIAGVENEQ